MRLRVTNGNENIEDLRKFANWILDVGDRKLGILEDSASVISIPPELLIKEFDDPIEAIVQAIYGDYLKDLTDFSHLQGRAILAPTTNIVEEVNHYMLSLNRNKMKTYLSCNSASFKGGNNTFDNLHTPEFLATIKASGLPNHELNFKEGCPVMLIQNIDHSTGLCNGTKLVITKLGEKIIQGEVLSGDNAGDKVLIPRITLTPSNARLPFKFQRRQYPLILSYAMTINKSQGQSLNQVGLLLKHPIFTHGQLYVAVSRVISKNGLKIVISHDDSNNSIEIRNVVYYEVLRSISSHSKNAYSID